MIPAKNPCAHALCFEVPKSGYNDHDEEAIEGCNDRKKSPQNG